MKRIIADVRKCLGCRSCELACAVAHSAAKELLAALREERRPEARVNVEAAGSWGVPLQCRHCDDPVCVQVCPTKAITKPAPDGPVELDADRCIGCAYCVQVCPFGVIRLSKSGEGVVRCDLCASRPEGPACVEACPTGALSFEEVEETARRARKKAAREVAEVTARQEEG